MYKETKNEVITGEGITDSFTTYKGVRQGCPLSPTLFNIYTYRGFRGKMGKEKRGGNGDRVTKNLLFKTCG